MTKTVRELQRKKAELQGKKPIQRKKGAIYDAVRAVEGSLDKIQDLWDEGIIAAAENYDAERTVAKNATTEKAAPEGDVKYQAWDRRDINRAFIDYKNITASNKAVRSKTRSLVSRGKTVNVAEAEIATLVNATNWADKGEGRRFFKSILRDAVGTDTLYFEFDGATLDAFMTKEGRNHAAGGQVTAEKAAIASKIRQLIINSEYTYSSKHNRHSRSGQKMPGTTEWDYFTAVADTGRQSIPVIFSIRSENRVQRSQIYNMAIKQEEAVSHDANLKTQSGQSNYGASTSSKAIVAKGVEESKAKFQMIGEIEETDRLVAVHNKSVSGLKRMLARNGVPFPSIAIKKAGDEADRLAKLNSVEGAQFQVWDNTQDDTAAEANGREASYARLESENAIIRETVTALQKLNAKQDKTIEKLQNRLRLTKTPETRTADARKLARDQSTSSK